MNTFIRLVALCCLAFASGHVVAQEVTGRVVDDDGRPLTYANVVALALPDSSFVSGVMTDAEGTFAFVPPQNGSLLRVSSVGYKTVYVERKDYVGTVVLAPESRMLGEVVVKSGLPTTRLKGEGMVTGVSGTVLEHAGTLERLLDRIPNVSAGKGEIVVFGRGKPEIYINGRKMRDDSELYRLASDNVKEVEVIMNPGARYDASVTSVIRITTKKAVGEGFGLDNRLYGELNDYGYLVGGDRLNMSYRRGGLDIDLSLRAAKKVTPDPKENELATYLEDTWNQDLVIDQVGKREDYYARLAASYMFDGNHSAGVSVRFNCLPWYRGTGYMNSTLTRNGVSVETLRSDYIYSRNETGVQGNAYYVGKIGGFTIDFNTDWMWGAEDVDMNTVEDYVETEHGSGHNDVDTRTENRNMLVASKLVATAPLFGGTVSLGGEYSYSERKTLYSVLPKGIIGDDKSRIEEGMATVFFEYSRQFGRLGVQAGLRYENVDFDYYDDGAYVAGQSKAYGNFFPSLALSAMFGRTAFQLGYSAGIHRPAYNQLRSSIHYDNRYIYEGGNPFLKPSRSHDVNFAVSYKWLMFSAVYSHVIDPIIQTCETYGDDPAVALFKQVNGRAYDKVSASVSLRPVFGPWHPSVMLGVRKQWFGMDVYGHNPLGNPIANLRFGNTLDTRLCQISLDMECLTTGADENNYMRKPSFTADLSLYKAFLDGRLSVQLYVDDIFKTNRKDCVCYYGAVRKARYTSPAQREINLTVRYKFNVARSKYKGTGAGQGQKDRF